MVSLIDLSYEDSKRANEGEPFKIVLVGVTGTGKTDLIYLIKNYAKQHGNNFQPSNISKLYPSQIAGESVESSITKFEGELVESDTTTSESETMISDTTYSCSHDIDIPEMKLGIC